MKYEVEAISDRGCVRGNNEDMILLGAKLLRDGRDVMQQELGGQDILLCAVADGMGGHNAGEVASQMVLEKLCSALPSTADCFDASSLKERITGICIAIHGDLLKSDEGNDKSKGMGTTLVGLLYHRGNLYSLNVGDSRLYRFRRGFLMQITKDHSLREVSGDDTIPSNIILNSFGAVEKFFIDIDDVSVLSGDIFILCSDGLSDMITDDEMEAIIKERQHSCCQYLVDAAKEKGGKDNVSVICAKIE